MVEEDILRENIISADGKTFGGMVEIVVSKLNALNKASDSSHDRLCGATRRKIEVKAVRALNKKGKLSENNLVEIFLHSKIQKKLVTDADKKIANWDGGICQVKLECFDTLYYAAFFHDKIYIFKITPDEIINDKNISFSDKQHRGGKMGQFHLKPTCIQYHIDNYLYHTLSYAQLVAILKS